MYKLLVIGFSAGGIPLVTRILQALPHDYPLPVVIVSHLPKTKESSLAGLLDQVTPLAVSTALDKEAIKAGHVYLAPPGYHLLVERRSTHGPSFALSVDEPVQNVRPSIDVLFESAAEVFETSLIAVLLSGANSDGAQGMLCVKQLGGLGIVLSPQECEFNTMGRAALERVPVDYVVGMEEIVSLLHSVHERP
jgi:two-component system chemotaxis response regulator CheB